MVSMSTISTVLKLEKGGFPKAGNTKISCKDKGIEFQHVKLLKKSLILNKKLVFRLHVTYGIAKMTLDTGFVCISQNPEKFF